MYGKMLRMARLFNPVSQKICVIPIDHGTTIGPVEGLRDYLETMRQITAGGADALVLHKGLLREAARCSELARGRFILHLSASSNQGPTPQYKVLVGSVEEAVLLGADGVSIHVNLGTEYEAAMLKDFGRVAGACLQWGMPLLAMMYTHKTPKETAHIAHAARLAEEMGADLVKIDFPGSAAKMAQITGGVRIPVIIAGGSKLDRPEKLLFMIDEALAGGASGVAIGRNVFQHPNPRYITSLISKLVHGELRLEDCQKKLELCVGGERDEHNRRVV